MIVTVEVEEATVQPNTDGAASAGIDFNLSNFATLSDDELIVSGLAWSVTSARSRDLNAALNIEEEGPRPSRREWLRLTPA